MGCSMPGFPVFHHLLEFAQMHVHWVSDAIQLSHPLAPPPPLAFSLSQHQGLFQWVGSSHQVAKLLEFQLQHQPFQWIFRVDFLYDWLLCSPCHPRDSLESSPAPQFESINSSVLSLLYVCTWTHSKSLNSERKGILFLLTCCRGVCEKPWQQFWWDLTSNKSCRVVPPFKSGVDLMSLNHAHFQLGKSALS